MLPQAPMEVYFKLFQFVEQNGQFRFYLYYFYLPGVLAKSVKSSRQNLLALSFVVFVLKSASKHHVLKARNSKLVFP